MEKNVVQFIPIFLSHVTYTKTAHMVPDTFVAQA